MANDYKNADIIYTAFMESDLASALEMTGTSGPLSASTVAVYQILSFDSRMENQLAARQAFREAETALLARLDKAKRLLPQAAGDMDRFATRVQDIFAELKRAIDLHDQGRTQDALRTLFELDPISDRWRQDIADWNDARLAALQTKSDAMTVTINSAIRDILLSVGLSFLAIIGLSLYIASRGITGPLDQLRRRMTSLATGETQEAVAGMDRRDEIGRMAEAVTVFRDNAIERIRLESEAEANRSLSETERLQREADNARAAAEVKFAVDSLAGALSRLADGDVSYRIDRAFTETLDQVRHDFNNSADKLQTALMAVAHNARGIDAGANEIKSAADDLAKRTEQQAAAVEETAAALEEITTTVRDSSRRASEAGELVARTRRGAEQSGEVVQRAVSAMEKIAKSSSEISSIIGVIDEIAFQTNLLALNAGVEAARAGDAGKGFAVVAQEVRELAQRSANAAKEIKALISASNVQVQEGVHLVGETGKALETIVAEVHDINRHVSAIVESAQEQSSGLQQINMAVNLMDQDTQKNAAMVEESTAASHGLAREVAALNELLSQFRLERSQPVALSMAMARSDAAAAPSAARALSRRLSGAFSGRTAVASVAKPWSEV